MASTCTNSAPASPTRRAVAGRSTPSTSVRTLTLTRAPVPAAARTYRHSRSVSDSSVSPHPTAHSSSCRQCAFTSRTASRSAQIRAAWRTGSSVVERTLNPATMGTDDSAESWSSTNSRGSGGRNSSRPRSTISAAASLAGSSSAIPPRNAAPTNGAAARAQAAFDWPLRLAATTGGSNAGTGGSERVVTVGTIAPEPGMSIGV